MNSNRIKFVALIALIVSNILVVICIRANPIKISGNMVPGGDVATARFKFSPDSSRVVFSSDQEIANKYELYSVSVDGGPRTKLSGISIGAFDDSLEFVISPDSKTVVYTIRTNDVNNHNLFSVPIVGGTPNAITNILPTDRRTSAGLPAVSPDGKYIVYRIFTQGLGSIYSVPIAGGASIPLNNPNAGDQGLGRFKINSDSQYVVYETINNDGDLKISSVPITGGSSSVLNLGSLDSLSQNDFDAYRLNSTGSHVVYRAELEGVDSVYSVPIEGGMSQKLSIESDVSVGKFNIGLDGMSVVYSFDSEIYSTPIVGGEQVKLNISLDPGESVIRFQLVPDGDSVFYVTGSIFGTLPYERFRVPISGGASSPVNINVSDSVSTSGLIFSSNSLYMVYSGAEGAVFSSQTYTDGVATKINIDQGTEAVIRKMKINPDSSRVFYISRRLSGVNGQGGEATPPQLYSVSIDGRQKFKISELPPLIDPSDAIGVNAENSVSNYQISPDSKYVIFTADLGVFGQQELYSYRLPDQPINDESEACIAITGSNNKQSAICL